MYKIWWYGIVRLHARSLEIALFESAYDFLLAFHSNYVPILHRFSDMVRYLSKMPILT